MRIKTLLFIFLTCITPLKSDEISLPLDYSIQQPLLILTLPKSGTHLFSDILFYITGNPCTISRPLDNGHYRSFQVSYDAEQAKENALSMFENKKYFLVHPNFENLVDHILEKYPDTPIVILIRDLRDVCVSLGYYWKRSTWKLEPSQKVMWAITNGFDQGVEEDLFTCFNLSLSCKSLHRWMQHPNAHLFKFEDLVGLKGGGSLEAQQESIEKIVRLLGTSISPPEVKAIGEAVWGRNDHLPKQTFRQGKIGSWREHFQPQHIGEFKKRLGSYLIDFGYEEDDSWE